MAGLWQRTGNVTVTNGSRTVTGFGTKWKTGTLPIQKGHAFYGPDGLANEVDTVVSDTEILLVEAYRGGTLANQPYKIDITRTSTISQFSAELSALVGKYRTWFDSMMTWLTGSGDVDILNPDTGATVTISSWKKVASEGEGQAARSKVEADRSRDEANRAKDEADKAAGIVALAALPLPDVWAPLTDSLRLFTGYGREVKVGDDVIARMLTFTRSTTKTYTNRDGVLTTAAVNEPTFDQWGLQLDGQSQNLVPSSESSVFAAGNAGFQTITNGVSGILPVVGQRIAFAPNAGETNATLVQFPLSLQGGQTYTFSCFMKVEQGQAPAAPENSLGVYSTATATIISRNVVRDLGNGVYRVALTFSVGGTGNQPVYLRFSRAGLPSELWVAVIGGSQVENLPFASSYVPTAGAAFTRTADLLTLQNPLNIPVGAGDVTVALEVRRNQSTPLPTYPKVFNVSDATWLIGDSTRFAMRGGTGEQGQLLKNAPGTIETVVYRIKGDQITVRCGSASASITRTGAILPNSTVTNIGSGAAGTQNLFGHVRNLRVWRRALTDDQMKAIA